MSERRIRELTHWREREGEGEQLWKGGGRKASNLRWDWPTRNLGVSGVTTRGGLDQEKKIRKSAGKVGIMNRGGGKEQYLGDLVMNLEGGRRTNFKIHP